MFIFRVAHVKPTNLRAKFRPDALFWTNIFFDDSFAQISRNISWPNTRIWILGIKIVSSCYPGNRKENFVTSRTILGDDTMARFPDQEPRMISADCPGLKSLADFQIVGCQLSTSIHLQWP